MKELKRHAPVWLLIYLLWTYIKSSGSNNIPVYLVINLFNVAVYMIAYYSLKHVYIPHLFNKKKYIYFGLSIIVTSLILYLFMHINDVLWFGEFGGWKVPSISIKRYLQKAIQHYSPAMIFLAWDTQRDSINEKKRIKELESEKIATELKFLKAQLNPHFLFNTLHNLYSQVITESGKAPDMILQLSAILDYVLYKSQNKSVQLREEVEIIEHFLALEKIRYGDRLDTKLTISGKLGVGISPLLILSLVENAFKHGVTKGIDRATVNIEIKVDGDSIFCKVWNSKSEFHEIKRDDHRKGLGLSNIKRQLKISYPTSHTLEIEENKESFCVQVTIKKES